METFPSIEPTYTISKDVSPLGSRSPLGDGYGKSIRFSLNLIKPVWSIQWMVSAADASTIDLFLKQRGDDGDWFYWTPPDGDLASCWRCDEWTIDHESPSLVKINASFRQVFELEVASVVPDDTCYSACEEEVTDWGPDVWIMRLQGEGPSGNFSANCYTFENGIIYAVYQLGGELHVAKILPNGTRAWVMRYDGLFYTGYYLLHLAADEANNRLFITWQISTSAYNATRPRHIIACVNVSTRQLVWATNYSFDAAWTVYCDINSELVQGVITSLSYDPLIGYVAAFATAPYSFCLFDPASGAPLSGNISSVGFGDFFYFIEAGYLGSQAYTLYCMGELVLLPGHSYLQGGTGYTGVGTGNSSSDLRFISMGLLPNKQAVLIFEELGSETWELMVIESNGRIVDHVRYISAFPGNYSFQPELSRKGWPDKNSTVNRLKKSNTKFSIDRLSSKLYISALGGNGVNVYAVNVTVNATGQIISIGNYFAGMMATSYPSNGQGLYDVFGSHKAMARGTAARRTTVIASSLGGLPVNNNEIAIMSVNRRATDTSFNWFTYSATNGSETGVVVGSTAGYRANQFDCAPTRIGLRGSLGTATINNTWTVTATTTPCDGVFGTKFFFASSINTSYITAVDVTSSQVFNTYSGNIA